MNESKRTVRLASTSANKVAVSAEMAVSRSSMLLNKLKESTNLINELKDERKSFWTNAVKWMSMR